MFSSFRVINDYKIVIHTNIMFIIDILIFKVHVL